MSASPHPCLPGSVPKGKGLGQVSLLPVPSGPTCEREMTSLHTQSTSHCSPQVIMDSCLDSSHFCSFLPGRRSARARAGASSHPRSSLLYQLACLTLLTDVMHWVGKRGGVTVHKQPMAEASDCVDGRHVMLHGRVGFQGSVCEYMHTSIPMHASPHLSLHFASCDYFIGQASSRWNAAWNSPDPWTPLPLPEGFTHGEEGAEQVVPAPAPAPKRGGVPTFRALLRPRP